MANTSTSYIDHARADRPGIKGTTTPMVPGLDYSAVSGNSTAGRIAAQRQARWQSRNTASGGGATGNGRAGQRDCESSAYGGWWTAPAAEPRSKSFGNLADSGKDFAYPFKAESLLKPNTHVSEAVKAKLAQRPAEVKTRAHMFGGHFTEVGVTDGDLGDNMYGHPMDVYGRKMGTM